MLNTLKQFGEDIFEEVVAMRRMLHKNPELAFEERETAQFVQAQLQGLAVSIEPHIAQTGVMVTLQGKHSGPTLYLRADMDALPIQEENTFDFVSQNLGKMHACGHDAHTASLIGTLKILHALRENLHGTIRCIFQPSEEKLPGGAKVMMEAGIFEPTATYSKPHAIFGQHVAPDLPIGKIGIREGMYMASSDELHIIIKGQGGHAAAPHYLTADPVLVASHVIVAMQSVISRNCPPNIPSVLSFGKVIADGATNVIPETVYLAGTFRTMDETWRYEAHHRMKQILEHTTATFGASYEFDLLVGYPALYNHPKETQFLRQKAEDFVGKENVVELDQWFASEDFAWYLREVPGSFYRIGTRNEAKGIVHGLHTPRFNIDEEALRISPAFMAYLALSYGQSAKRPKM